MTTYSPHKYQGTGEYCDQCGGDELHHYWKDGEVVGNGVRSEEVVNSKKNDSISITAQGGYREVVGIVVCAKCEEVRRNY